MGAYLDLSRGIVALRQLELQGLTNEDLLFLAVSPLAAMTVVEMLHDMLKAYGNPDVEKMARMSEPSDKDREALSYLLMDLEQVVAYDLNAFGVHGPGRLCYKVLLTPVPDKDIPELFGGSRRRVPTERRIEK